MTTVHTCQHFGFQYIPCSSAEPPDATTMNSEDSVGASTDKRGRFSKGDTRAEFELCFVLDVSFKQVYIAQVDLIE